MKKLIEHIGDMDNVAREILGLLCTTKKNTSRATVLGLSGELGAGKTTFTQSFARALSVAESVPSPTFVIARFYKIPSSAPFQQLIHVDAYRIESPDELRPIGWSKLIADTSNLILVEWPEKMGALFPYDAPTIHFHVVNETTRSVTVDSPATPIVKAKL